MKQNRKLRWILASAASVALASSAWAQFQVGAQGRANEANNRIGSAGLNDPVYQPPRVTYGNYNNDLITGNVTGGKEFRGSVPYTSPDAFRGRTAGGISDSFIRNSSAAPYGRVPQNNAQVSRTFVGASEYAPAPPGFVQQSPGTGAYIQAPQNMRQPGDMRTGVISDSPSSVPLPRPGQVLLPGPVDPSTQASTMITASPLYGARQWNMADQNAQEYLRDNMGRGDLNSRNLVDPVTLQKYRDELVEPDARDVGMLEKQQNPFQLDNAAPKPFDAPSNQSLSPNAALRSNQPLAPTPLSSGLQNNLAGTRPQRLKSPQQQSTQYAELQKRLEENRTAQAIVDANSQATASREAQPQAGTNTARRPGQPNMPATPGNPLTGGTIPTPVPGAMPVTPGVVSPTPAALPPQIAPPPIAPPPIAVAPSAPVGVDRPAPLKINSLAQGVQAKGLADLLKEAETQMKAGRFSSALEEYDLAEQIAPNNPLILLGRANAELGQSYYGRAEAHLRQAFMQDPALLMAQVDLRSWLGTDRLEILMRDLRGIADREQKEARPVFLLAYIDYNTGNERRAAAYLDLAEKRAGTKDELYTLIRKHWSLPPGGTPDLSNK